MKQNRATPQSYLHRVLNPKDWTVKLLIGLLLFDFLVIGLHVWLSSWTTFFHLDYENNFPTVYQSFKLFTGGYLVLFMTIQFWNVLTKFQKWLLVPLSALYIFIGLDELGQLHENTDAFVREVSPEFADGLLAFAQSIGYVSSTWMLYYIPFFILIGIYGLFLMIYILKNQRHHFITFLIGASIVSLVLIFEFVSNQGQVDPQLYERYILIEESAEMIAISIGVFFAAQFQRDVIKG